MVPNSNEFFIYEKFEVQKCPRTDISERWHPEPLLKIFNVSERTGMSVVPRSSDGDVSKVGYFFDIPASLKLSLYTVMT